MSTSIPVRVVSSSRGWIATVAGVLEETPDVFGTVEEFLAADLESGGLLLLDPDVPERETRAVASALAGSGAGWSVFRGGVPEAEGGVEIEPVPLPGSCGLPLADVVSRLRRNGEDAPRPELCQVLRFVARARHDINNPLTSALAETQLLLLDVEDPAIRSGLETVEAQLHRIRDLVARLQALPRPRPRD